MAMVVQIGADVQQAVKGVKDVSLTLKDQQAVLKSLRAEYAALSTEQAKSALGKEMAADIKTANEEIKRLEAGATSGFSNIGRAVGGAITPIRQLAYILPGIGIAGIFNIAFEGIGKLVEALAHLDTGVDHLKDLEDSLAGAKKSFVSASETVETLRINIGLAKDGFISKAAVVKEYNETIGKTTGLVNSLDDAEAQLTKNGDAYIRVTFLKAAANIALGKAGELAFENAVKAQEEVDNTIKALSRQPQVAKDSTGGLGQILPRVTDAQEAEARETINKQVKIINESSEKVQAANKKKIDDFQKIAKDLQSQAAALSSQLGFNLFDDTKIKKDLQKKLDKPFIFKGFVNLELVDLAKINFPELIGKGANFEKFKKDLEDKLKNPSGTGALEIKIPIKAQLVLDQKQKAADLTRELNKELSKAAESGARDFAAAFGEGLGSALSGGGIKSIFGSLFNSLSQTMKAFGEALIKFGVGALAVKSLITNPALAIAAGIALIAASSLIANSIPKFAEGGVVNRATLGVFGENGTEVVMPLNRLKGMLQGGINANANVSGEFTIRGRDLKLILARENSSQLRTT